jgi:ADP-ribosylglycohydrolase
LNSDPFIGCLLGTAVGDALGLPYEGLSPARAARLFPDATRHHLVFGKGLVSDDTEHAAFVADALVRSRGDVDVFRKQLARSLRWWLASLPAGVGFATLRSIIRLWLGVPPDRSGVDSAGNGPAMRSAILGVAFGHDGQHLRRIVRASTEITHRDPRAYYAALGVAIAAINVICVGDAWQAEYLHSLKLLMPEDEALEFRQRAEQAMHSAQRGEALPAFALTIGSGRGISGYCYHTVPCVLQVWFRHGDDFALGLPEIIAAGGDTDTAGAIFGAIVGARLGRNGVPRVWLDGIIEWPRTISWLERLGETVAVSLDKDEPAPRSPGLFWPGIVPRNLIFLCIVLLHGLRRLLPPY